MGRRAARTLVIVCGALLMLGPGVVVGAPASHAATNTIVSLTFDDGTSSHPAVATMLQNHGMRGTFYINSAEVGTSSYYMTWNQIHTLADNGHEIGGHTLHHTNLTNVSRSTATTEVCQDRQNLLNQGFSPVNSFAYPEAAVNSTAESVVASCYTGVSATARGVGNLFDPQFCDGCPYAETIPPQDRYWVSTANGIDSSTTLAQLEAQVTNAENHGGGWVIYAFHGVCDNQCTDSNTVRTSLFTNFLDWLQPRSANGTVVQTVNQAMTGTPPPPPPPPSVPTTTIACNGSTCTSGWYKAPVTITLTASPSSGTTTQYSTDGGATWNTYSGPFSLSSPTTVQYRSSNSAGTEATKSQTVNVDGTAPTNVAVISPANGASFRRGTTITLTATASDAPSGVASVTFLYDGRSVGTSTTSPYSVNYRIPNGNATGSHVIRATATDRVGNATTSAAVSITVRR
jgi:peptidoglycan/xylan/chitin deacetylase (PgdA/CDA1 family)